MLEGLVTWLLNNYIGEFVENLNTRQLSITVFQGEVELENLPLKKDALRKLNLPLDVRSGVIGRIHLSIPLKHLQSEPWVITLEKLHLIACPVESSEYNEAEEKDRNNSIKQAALRILEEKLKNSASTSSKWSVTSLMSDVLENIQLIVKDVHIRYEDNTTISGTSFACGIRIKSLSAQSADQLWVPRFVSHDDTGMMRKLVDLQELSIYMNSDAHLSDNLNDENLDIEGCKYILNPVSAQAKMKRNTSALPLNKLDEPRINFDINLEKIPFSLGEGQFSMIALWTKEFERRELSRKYIRWKPTCNIKENPVVWWNYAIEANLHPIRDKRRRSTKKFLLQRCQDIVRYVDAYMDFISIGTAYMEPTAKEFMDNLEEELSIEEITILREIGRSKINKPLENDNKTSDGYGSTQGSESATVQEESSSATQSKESDGIFQRWFPGWYKSSLSVLPEQTSVISEEEQNFEREVFEMLHNAADDDTILYKDMVFVHVNFSLSSGIFTLMEEDDKLRESTALIEIECTNIAMNFDSMPKSNSMTFGTRIGGLFMTDKMTSNSVMPMLVAPQQRDQGSHTPGSPTGSLSGVLDNVSESSTSPFDGIQDQPIFQLVYEKNPPDSQIDNRLEIHTKPLDIVYNPATISRIKNFFSMKQASDVQHEVPDLAKSRYEAIMKQTGHELKQTLDDLLKEEKAHQWSFHLDIAAPQIIVPQNFSDPNTSLVVFDLGHLHFQNMTAGIKYEHTLQEDESSKHTEQKPDSEADLENKADTTSKLTEIFQGSLSEAAVRDKIYDKYMLNLSDLQVLVGHAQDNWRFAHSRGTSNLHVIDKFSLSLQFHRRLLHTNDPRWPKTTFMGTLPTLTLHVNETKINALSKCVEYLSDQSGFLVENKGEDGPALQDQPSTYYSVYQSYTENLQRSTIGQHNTGLLAVSKLMTMEFTINKVSLEVQSRGRSIAELQVFQVHADLVSRPYDTSATFGIHSLLVVDALQTYGQGYELLVTSHKGISDCGSTLNPPVSSGHSQAIPRPAPQPTSPQQSRDTVEPPSAGLVEQQPGVLPTAPKQALTSSGCDLHLQEFNPKPRSDALIKVEMNIKSPHSSSLNDEDGIHTAHVQFNNLDFIANQETIVELIAFFGDLFPSKSGDINNELHEDDDSVLKEQNYSRWALNAKFNRMSILLIRVDANKGRNVARATMSNAKVDAKFVYGSLDMNGSLGSLQIQNLTPESQVHTHVLSIGTNHSKCDKNISVPPPTPCGSSTDGCINQMQNGVNKAFSFTLSMPCQKHELHTGSKSLLENDRQNMVLTLRMASMWYTHSPDFLVELSVCVNEFHDYMANLGSSLKSAATEMAKGLVNQHLDLKNSSPVPGTDLDKGESVLRSDPQMMSSSREDSEAAVPLLDVILESPVILLPRNPHSSEVLEAHLGKITLRNFDYKNNQIRNDQLFVEVRDMSLYSMDLKKKRNNSPERMDNVGVSHTADDSCSDKNEDHLWETPILHDTVMELKIEKLPTDASKKCTTLLVTGCIASPLKLALSKNVYEQILNTMDHLTPNTEGSAPTKGDVKYSSMEELPATNPPTVSALKLGPEVTPPGSTDRPPEPHILNTHDSSVLLRVAFEIPDFTVGMTGDLGEGVQKGLVDLHLAGLKVRFEKKDPWVKSFEISLQSLVIYDLLQEDMEHQFLMSSENQKAKCANPSKMGISQSCPTSMIDISQPDLPPSLPSSLHTENVFTSAEGAELHPQFLAEEDIDGHPAPLTRTDSVADPMDNQLVHLRMTLVDKHCPNFDVVYNSTNRFIDVDFNGLDTTVNLQTWVVLLDFLGLGAKVHDVQHTPKEASSEQDGTSEGTPEIINSEVKLKVESLSLILNKKEYELARANVSRLDAKISLRDGNFAVNGKLGSMSLQDESPNGFLYKERFLTTGSQALSFDIFKYGTPDPDLHREHDISIKICVSSVWYVHSQRFLQEILAFCQNFTQLQDVLGRSRAASAGQKIAETAFRSSRMSIDVDAGAPVILIPHSSKSKDILVMDLGHLQVKNSFLLAGSEGTINKKGEQLIQERNNVAESSVGPYHSVDQSAAAMKSSLSDSVYGSFENDWREFEVENTATTSSSQATSASLSGFCSAFGENLISSAINVGGQVPRQTVPPQPSPSQWSPSGAVPPEVATHRCLLDVWDVHLTEMDLFSAEWQSKETYLKWKKDDLKFPSYVVERECGKVLKEKCELHLQVERNLEGDISHSVPDLSISGKLTSLYFQLDINQYKLVRGLLAHNFGEQLEPFQKPMMSQLQDPKIHTVLSGDVWTGLSITLDLDGVTTELLKTKAGQGQHNKQASLAKFDFITSRLSFNSYSDGSKDIDLVSHEIKIFDTRYDDNPVNVRPNVFPEILRPTNQNEPSALQMEVHYRSNREVVKFTVLLNNMRVMGIFDWLLACKDFLFTGPEDPYKQDTAQASEDFPQDAQQTSSQAGILTKRGDSVTQKKENFELRLNVTDTELAVVERSNDWDTKAIIFKSTAVFTYKPAGERPMSCSLQSLEVFSCSLAAEDDTALSIVDPMSVTLELSRRATGNTGAGTAATTGLCHVGAHSLLPPVLEVSFEQLNIRLSYNDMKLFLAILKTMPKQLVEASKYDPSLPKNAAQCNYQGVGVPGSVVSEPSAPPAPLTAGPDDHDSGMVLAGFQVKANTICLCFIDDCLDADVPLVELTFSEFHFLHQFMSETKGNAEFNLNGDYYNRALSGWEPFIEQWGCVFKWHQDPDEENKLCCSLLANNVLNINITSTLLELYSKTKVKWTKDYYMQSLQDESTDSGRKRAPFIPFVIRNYTGSKLWFATMTTTPTRISADYTPQTVDPSQYMISEWTEVRVNKESAFTFQEREKMRHQHTHQIRVHQLVVQVDGWQEMAPVSVDRVGVYFRYARPQTHPTQTGSSPAARIVFEVTQEGSAQKCISVRSGLVLANQLEDDVEIRLQNTLAVSPVGPAGGTEQVVTVPRAARQAIPLSLVHSRMWLRPLGWSLDWCQKPLLWQHVARPGEHNDSINLCDTQLFSDKGTYRFCVSAYRQHFPSSPYALSASGQHSPKQGPVYEHPGHIITLMPPVRLENLLPVEMTYQIRTSGNAKVMGTIKPGKLASLVMADLTQTLELTISLDNFSTCKELVIPPCTLDYKVKLVLSDREQQRNVELVIRIKAGMGGSLKLSVSVPYWLLNRTGLPLIFRQEGGKTAAGQYEEHELARSVTPLLFSYTDKDKAYLCQMRLGKHVHGIKAVAQWCRPFSLERGCGVRPLYVSPNTNQPDWVYMIGVYVQQGRGRYCDTHIITFSPRYQLDNRSCHKLAFTQKYVINNWCPSSVDYFSALPNCTLSFHWPRIDKDNLLCVKLIDDPHSHWSGAFKIDGVESFHINIRVKDSITFLRVDIVLQRATFFVVFSDADQMPPPYKIQNFSAVPLLFYQAGTTENWHRSQLRPASQVSYALDEPTLPPQMTVKVLGGSKATYNMNNIKSGEQLYYENHIYLAFTGTFQKPTGELSLRWVGQASYVEQQLVLDVLPSNKVILKTKEAGKRSQLWRMTSTGMLQHEGSAVPHDPKRPSSGAVTSYVLDIQDIALQPATDMLLTIRKAEHRRQSSQTWKFTKDGRLCLAAKRNLCVQAQGGFFGLRDGVEAVLGPSLPGPYSQHHIPIEMAVHNEKSRPGSGQLAVKVSMDGPTRVLCITDVTQQDQPVGEAAGAGDGAVSAERASQRARVLQVKINLSDGIGMSVVNRSYEELLYVSLRDIQVMYSSSLNEQDIDVTINRFQIDNQLAGGCYPVLLYVTPHSRHDDEEDQGPAIHVRVCKVTNNTWNADIYKHLVIVMKRLTLQIEETLLWKLLQFAGFKQTETELQNLSETGIEPNREVVAATSSHLKRYYFGLLKLDVHHVMLSMLTATDLSPDLVLVKKSLGIPLVKFADAQVDLEAFVRHHPFETLAFLLESIQIHFTEELKSQAASILGSVDFLGNPLGFFNDVAEGVSGLLEGNVGGLFKNVTHGVSNSAAKVTGSLSDGLGVATLDNQHQKIREQIRYHSQGHKGPAGSNHLIAGLKGLGHGLFGGLTSIVSQTYTGAKSEGVEGFFTGFGKGVVGTVTKPVAGVLDFAAGAASAVRDTSRSSSKREPAKSRLSRVSVGPGGLLQPYSHDRAHGQHTINSINAKHSAEICIAVEMIRADRDDSLRALISTEHVYFLGKSSQDKETIVLHLNYEEIFNCRSVSLGNKHYLELTIHADGERNVSSRAQKVRKAPIVRCDTEAIAQRVSQQINYAKVLFEEVKHTLPTDSTPVDD